MNTTQLIETIAENTKLSKTDVSAVLANCKTTIQETLGSGEKVNLVGFGVYELIEKTEHMGRNPKTNAQIPIPASKKIKYSMSKTFRDSLDK